MINGELWFFYALTFGAVLLAVQGLYVLLFKARHEKSAINRRLVLTAQLTNPTEVLEALRRERGVEFLLQHPFFQGLNNLVVQSGKRLSGISLITIGSVLIILYFALLRFVLGMSGPAFGLAIPLAAGSLLFYLRRARSRRIKAFSEQFPDALDVIVRGLHAGHPFRVSLGLAARETADPVGSEFGIVADEIMFGLDQSAAIENMCKRVGQPDLNFFATAVTIQNQTGGNLAEILSRLSKLLRSRTKLRLKIRSLSSEGRLSGVALSLAPFVLFGIITLISPEYFGAVRNHPIIPLATGAALTLLAIGNIVMYRMVNFRF
jgi:tight adherence protein B